MTSYERVRAAVSHRQPDRPPLELLASKPAREALHRHFGTADEEGLLTHLGVDFRTVSLPIDKAQPLPPSREAEGGRLSVSPYGVVTRRSGGDAAPGRPAGPVYGPFYDTEDLDSFDWPTPEDVPHTMTVYTEIRRFNQAGLCSVAVCDNPFSIAYLMRPYEQFLIDCRERPDYVAELLTRISAVEFARAESAVAAGARAAILKGDFAFRQELLIGREQFRSLLRPVLEEFVFRLKAVKPDVMLFLHSGGNLSAVLPDLVECGYAAVHPIDRDCADLEAVKAEHGSVLTLFGGVSTRRELAGGSPAGIRELVRRRIDSLGRGGGLILAPTERIALETTAADGLAENVAAMYAEARVGEGAASA
jgi:uroporphyrinogen decarboxylase